MKYQYRERSYEDVQRLRRRFQQHKAAQKAYRGDPGDVAAVLRAEGLDAFADLIEQQLKPSKRRVPAPPGSFDEIKQQVIRIMRARSRRRKFAAGERSEYLDALLTRMAEEHDLECLSDAERERLRRDVLFDKGPDNRPDRRKRPR